MNVLLSVGQGAFDWTWKTSVSAAWLTVLVFAAQKLLGKWLTARWQYFLSLLVLIRLLLPIAPASPLSLDNLIYRSARPTQRLSWILPASDKSAETLSETQVDIIPSPLPLKRASMSSADYLCLAWLSGCCGLVALAIWRFRQWRSLIKEGEIISNPRLLALLDSARDALGVRRPVKALVVSQATGPAVFGIWNPCLLLPRNILGRLTDDELRFVFLHEMAHVRRQDALLNALFMMTQFLHWFNPLVWLALHRLRANRELVCDAMVLRITRPEERARYGHLLLKLMDEFPTTERFLPGTVAVIGDQKEIKRRIIMIKNHGQNRMAGCVLAVIAMMARWLRHIYRRGTTRVRAPAIRQRHHDDRDLGARIRPAAQPAFRRGQPAPIDDGHAMVHHPSRSQNRRRHFPPRRQLLAQRKRVRRNPQVRQLQHQEQHWKNEQVYHQG